MHIKELRALTGLSQAQFAKKYDIPVRTLQGWEIGKTTPPQYVIGMLEKLITEEYKQNGNK